MITADGWHKNVEGLMEENRQIKLDNEFFIAFAQVGAFFDILETQWQDEEYALAILKHYYKNFEVLQKYLLEDEDG